MLIERQSPFDGKWRKWEVPVTQEQLDAWQGGKLIQYAMPNLNADQREFIMTGITPEEWKETFENTDDN
jgi:hypothetical protein